MRKQKAFPYARARNDVSARTTREEYECIEKEVSTRVRDDNVAKLSELPSSTMERVQAIIQESARLLSHANDDARADVFSHVRAFLNATEDAQPYAIFFRAEEGQRALQVALQVIGSDSLCNSQTQNACASTRC